MTNSIKAIAFDFGNTLCAWDERQYWQVTRNTMNAICTHAPGHDFDSAYEVFNRLRGEHSARNLPRMVENDLVEILAQTAEELRGKPLSKSDLQEVVHTHVRSFVEVCGAPHKLRGFLDRLSAKYRLGLLSNYPISDCIRLSLKRMGIDGYFSPTIVSGDLGVIKPARRIFGELLAEMNLPPEEVLFVGDDWTADIVGACASGIPCVHILDSSAEREPRSLEGVFGVYLRKALESPELSCWAEAKPVAVMKSVLELEPWLEDRNA